MYSKNFMYGLVALNVLFCAANGYFAVMTGNASNIIVCAVNGAVATYCYSVARNM